MDRPSGCGPTSGPALGRPRLPESFATDRTNPEYWRYSLGIEKQFAAELGGRALVSRPKGIARPVRRAGQLRAAAVPLAERDPRQQRRDVPEPGGVQPVPGLDPGDTGQQRRDHRAAPAAAAVSAVRQPECRSVSRYEYLPCPAGASRETIHRWIDVAVVVHLVAVPRAGRAAQPVGGSRVAGWCGGPSASHHARRRRRAAVWPRTQMGQRLEQRARSDPRRLAVQHEI